MAAAGAGAAVVSQRLPGGIGAGSAVFSDVRKLNRPEKFSGRFAALNDTGYRRGTPRSPRFFDIPRFRRTAHRR